MPALAWLSQQCDFFFEVKKKIEQIMPAVLSEEIEAQVSLSCPIPVAFIAQRPKKSPWLCRYVA